MTATSYRQVQAEAFGELVRRGIYSAEFEHSNLAQVWFRKNVEAAFAFILERNQIRILDCGCGSGYWLSIVHSMLSKYGIKAPRLYGFDITPQMVELARYRLAGLVPPENFAIGDILDAGSYAFGDGANEFDLVIAYDVIQQLPRRLQADACHAVARNLCPGGMALIFDHDAESLHGLKMGIRKLLTRNLGIPLVPRYYCNARYPTLRRLATIIGNSRIYSARIESSPQFEKRVLQIRTRLVGLDEERSRRKPQ